MGFAPPSGAINRAPTPIRMSEYVVKVHHRGLQACEASVSAASGLLRRSLAACSPPIYRGGVVGLDFKEA